MQSSLTARNALTFLWPSPRSGPRPAPSQKKDPKCPWQLTPSASALTAWRASGLESISARDKSLVTAALTSAQGFPFGIPRISLMRPLRSIISVTSFSMSTLDSSDSTATAIASLAESGYMFKILFFLSVMLGINRYGNYWATWNLLTHTHEV